jgi:hypothetical protein
VYIAGQALIVLTAAARLASYVIPHERAERHRQSFAQHLQDIGHLRAMLNAVMIICANASAYGI